MKTCLIIALAWFVSFNLTANDALWAADARSSKISLTIESISKDGHVKVGIHNESADGVNIWVGPCSWAYFNWRVIDIRNDETRLYCPNPDEMFTGNFPQCAAIKPGAMFTEDLKLGSDDVWVNKTRPLIHLVGPKDTDPLLQSGDKIIVIYDVRWSEEANLYHAWSGITVASKDYHPK